MKTKQLIESWKNADTTRETDSPANNVAINENAMGAIIGGNNSAGYRCSLSGECNGGRSCWDILADFLGF